MCAEDKWPCNNGECIPSDKHCDGTADCSDHSDEKFAECSSIKCPAYSFQCLYGACVPGTAECNGISECIDNSDELTQNCPGKWNTTGSCDIDSFECSSTDCIPNEHVCDGYADCENQFDESILVCASVYCPAYAFRCAYGGCIDTMLQCNGVHDCLDGSDEIMCVYEKKDLPITLPSVMPMIETTTAIQVLVSSSTMPTENLFEDGSCFLKLTKHLKAYYNNEKNHITDKQIKNGHIIFYKCDESYSLTKGSISSNICLRGKWIKSQVPTCSIQCSNKVFSHHSIQVNYEFSGESIQTKEHSTPSTIASVICSTGYKKPIGHFPRFIECLPNGLWNSTAIHCNQNCGIRISRPLLHNAASVDISEAPWQVGIYSDTADAGQFVNKCGGSLINAYSIVSAAHCFWDTTGNKQHSSVHFRIGIGKTYRNYTAHEDNAYNIFNVSAIIIPDNYMDEQDNYNLDIAVVISSVRVRFSTNVRPICLDLSYHLSQLSMPSGRRGLLAGWGQTGTKEAPSEKLKLLELTSKSFYDCKTQSKLAFQSYVTTDKFCAGHLLEGNACDGDSGGGFVFINDTDKLLYLHGIVSNGPSKQGHCDTSQATTFTNVHSHIQFLKDHTTIYN